MERVLTSLGDEQDDTTAEVLTGDVTPPPTTTTAKARLWVVGGERGGAALGLHGNTLRGFGIRMQYKSTAAEIK